MAKPKILQIIMDKLNKSDVVNNLTTTIIGKALDASQGKILDDKINTKADENHTHTKSQISDFPTSLPANGGNADTVDGKHATDFYQVGIMNGLLQVANANIGNTGYLYTDSNRVNIRGGTSSTGYNYFGVGSDGVFINNAPVYHAGNKPTPADIGALPSNGGAINGYLTIEGSNALRCRHLDTNTPTGDKALYLNYYEGGPIIINTSETGLVSLGGELAGLKSSVSSGKTAIASAITAKGVTASGSDTHATLANKISQIPGAVYPTTLPTGTNYSTSISLYWRSVRLGGSSTSIKFACGVLLNNTQYSVSCTTGWVYRTSYNNPIYVSANTSVPLNFACIFCAEGGTFTFSGGSSNTILILF